MPAPVDVLIVSAHPDDAEMAMGGTMLALVQAGKRVLSVSLTSSQMSSFGTEEDRRNEFIAASKVIGCQFLMLEMMDTQLENDLPSRLAVSRLIRTYKPALVFAPYHTNNSAELRGIANRDHPIAGAITRDAAKISRLTKTLPELPPHTVQRLYFYMLPQEIRPNIVVDVTEQIDSLRTVLQCYSTQMSIRFNTNPIEEILLSTRKADGALLGIPYAETFLTEVPLAFSADTFVDLA